MNDGICERCGFVFSSYVPEGSFLSEYYADAHHTIGGALNVPPDFDMQARIRAVREFLPEGASILEIGASTGAFCEALRSTGFRAVGLDPLNQDAGDTIARDFIGNDQRSDLEQQLQQSFDAIVSYYVLEHVVDARKWLSEARRHLKEGGILVVEVPNYEKYPCESLHCEHVLHFSPLHLQTLVQEFGFEPLAIGGLAASRYFGFVLVARLCNRAASWNGSSVRSHLSSQCGSLVQLGKKRYLEAKELHEQEEQRLSALAFRISAEVSSRGPRSTQLIFWGANQYATSIAERLTEADHREMLVVDNSATKIGTLHEGFARPISAPALRRSEPFHRVFILCSPSWNWQIVRQIEDAGLEDITIIDAFAWNPDR